MKKGEQEERGRKEEEKKEKRETSRIVVTLRINLSIINGEQSFISMDVTTQIQIDICFINKIFHLIPSKKKGRKKERERERGRERKSEGRRRERDGKTDRMREGGGGGKRKIGGEIVGDGERKSGREKGINEMK